MRLNSNMAVHAIVVALVVAFNSQAVAGPEPEIRPDPIVYQRPTYWQTFQQLPPALRYSAYVGGAIGAAGLAYMGGTLLAPYLGLGGATTAGGGAAAAMPAPNALDVAWSLAMTHIQDARLPYDVVSKAVAASSARGAAVSDTLGSAIVTRQGWLFGQFAGKTEVILESVGDQAYVLGRAGRYVGQWANAADVPEIAKYLGGAVGVAALGQSASAAASGDGGRISGKSVDSAQAQKQVRPGDGASSQPPGPQQPQPSRQRQTGTTQPGSPIAGNNKARPIGGAGVNKPPQPTPFNGVFINDIWGRTPVRTDPFAGSRSDIWGNRSLSSLHPSVGGGIGAGPPVFRNDIWGRNAGGGSDAALSQVLNMVNADLAAGRACLANPKNCSGTLPYSLGQVQNSANQVLKADGSKSATDATSPASNKIMTPVLQPNGNFKYVDSGSSGKPVTGSASAKVAVKSAPSGISGVSITAPQAANVASGLKALSTASARSSALRPGGSTAVQQFAAPAPAGPGSNFAPGNPAAGSIVPKPAVNSNASQPTIRDDAGRKSPVVSTPQPPAITVRTPSVGGPAASGAASQAASGTASRAASTAASGAASRAASTAASIAASRAASTAASNAASRAASTAASIAASRAASTAASSAASRAASTAASNAASRAAAKAASAAASEAASNAAFNAANRVKIPSDIRLKRDIVVLGHTHDGLRLYRYRYLGSDTLYVGVMAQQVAQRFPSAVVRSADGYLEVDYGRLGIEFLTFHEWTARGAKEIRN